MPPCSGRHPGTSCGACAAAFDVLLWSQKQTFRLFAPFLGFDATRRLAGRHRPPAAEARAASEVAAAIEAIDEIVAIDGPVEDVEAVVEELEAAEELEAVEAAVAAAAARAPPEPATPDDLTIIGGVGPKLAERLTAAGVTSFAALAAWQADRRRALRGDPAAGAAGPGRARGLDRPGPPARAHRQLTQRRAPGSSPRRVRSGPMADGRGWVLDLDGVVWLADQAIAGSAEAIERLRAAGHDVRLRLQQLLGARSATVEDKLASFAIPARGQVVTSAVVAAELVEPTETVAALRRSRRRRSRCSARGVTDRAGRPRRRRDGRLPPRVRLRPADDRGARRCWGGARLVATNDDATYPTPDGPDPRAPAPSWPRSCAPPA